MLRYYIYICERVTLLSRALIIGGQIVPQLDVGVLATAILSA
ncbi:MAG: hypothetical protein AB1331_02605 [Bacillota bacterium]